ncbi:MAG: recombinase family protein, partial [Defluviitaleaceae bacterium]|nr:recombinase family protein [Defluviitaleaceae bacterium]
NPETKEITINHEEAEIVRYIFNRYIEGIGCSVIGKELVRMGHKTKRGNGNWAETTIMRIIKNEKYKGDIKQGKTFTIDPISKRRLENFGEQDQFYIEDNHEPIINRDIFDSAQQIVNRRGKNRKSKDSRREKFSRKYAFSSMLECGFCGSLPSRRSWHANSEYQKTVWQCVVNTKKGKQHCPDAKGIAEETIERAFLESYKLLSQNNKDIVTELLKRIEETLCLNDSTKELLRLEKEVAALKHKRKKLVDMLIDDIMDKETYDSKYADLTACLTQLSDEIDELKDISSHEADVKQRLDVFRSVLEQNEVIGEFDRCIFESIVKKVIVGGIDASGKKDPSLLTFVYKTGFSDSINGSHYKKERKNGNARKTTKQLYPNHNYPKGGG